MAKTAANVLVGVATLYYGAAGAAVGAITTEVGYTEDGVTIEYTPDVTDISVEEETVPIKRVIIKEEISITCNIAESSLNNIEKALAGASRADDVITLGGGVIQEIGIKIVGDSPAGADKRTIYCPYVNPVGTVGMSYKKGNKTIVPVTFKPFKNAVDATVCTITDAA
jgi:stage V sporulation protein SpoVS